MKMVKTYRVVGAYGAYGIAKLEANKIRETTKLQTMIFKDLSDTPFTSFRTDQYVVMIEVKDSARN
jgi:hypothetical protein